MDFLIENLIPYLLAYKYFALFSISFIAAVILPIPSGTLLMVATAFASEGYFNFGLIIIISIIANLLGDNLSYWIARIYGERIFSFIGFRRILKSKSLNKIEEQFRRRPGFVVLASRFEVLSTLTVNILAGISKVSYRKYLIHESIGTIAQVFFYGSIGYFFGYNWEFLNTIQGRLLIVLALVGVHIIIRFRARIKLFFKKFF